MVEGPPAARFVAIVDDDASQRSAILSVLKSAGMQAKSFPSAAAFLVSGQLRDCACIVADIEMPGMSGFDLLKHLNEKGPRIPIIFVSTYGKDESFRARAISGGAMGFLDKPVDAGALIELVASILER